MSRSDTIKLLILNDSRSEVERLASMLRNSGVSVRAQHAESQEALSKLLQEQSWDLLIGHDQTANLPLVNAIKEIRKLNLDLPVIAVTEEEGSKPVVEGIRAGCRDVILLDDDQHLLLIIEREVANRNHRQSQRQAERKRREAEQRAMRLLDSSRDAIAYVQDGMFLYCNETFAEILGYEDKDDLEAMPFIDVIADADQTLCKEVLKKFNFKGQQAQAQKITLNMPGLQGNSQPVEIEVSQATFENEACINFHAPYQALKSLMTAAAPVASTAAAAGPSAEEVAAEKAKDNAAKLRDSTTGLYNRNALYQQIEKALDGSADHQSTHALLLIHIADFNQRIINVLGYRQADMAMREISNNIRTWLNGKEFFARFNDSTFAVLLPNCSATPAQERAGKLVEQVNEHVFEVKSKTILVRLQIGVSLITETSQNSDQCIERARMAMEALRNEDIDNDGGYKLYEEKEKSSVGDATMAAKLSQAVENDNIYLLYQPIIGLRGSEEEQYEVLARIRDEDGHELANTDVFKEVSDPDVLNKFDRWVVLEAAKQLSKHRQKGNNTRLVVNLSQAIFEDTNISSWLKIALKAAELPPDAIIFQLREVDVTTHISKAKLFTESVAANGTPISLTNFGCVLNPLNTLKHVHADYIKLDRSYTQELQENPESTSLTNLVRELHSVKKITIVPFIENASALSKLWQAGVHYIQGHYLQEPHAMMNYDFNADPN